MNCTACQSKQCRSLEVCDATRFEKETIKEKYLLHQPLVEAAAQLVDFGRAGNLSRLDETIEFATRMKYKRIGLAYCYGMEKDALTVVRYFRSRGLKVSAASCTVGALAQNEVNSSSDNCHVACNPIGQATQLNNDGVDLAVTMGLCMGHDILFNREIKADITNFLVKDRVYGHAPLKALNAIVSHE